MWGTCLGFEELTYLTLGKLVLTRNNMRDVALPLNFTDGMDPMDGWEETPTFVDVSLTLIFALFQHNLSCYTFKKALKRLSYERLRFGLKLSKLG